MSHPLLRNRNKEEKTCRTRQKAHTHLCLYLAKHHRCVAKRNQRLPCTVKYDTKGDQTVLCEKLGMRTCWSKKKKKGRLFVQRAHMKVVQLMGDEIRVLKQQQRKIICYCYEFCLEWRQKYKISH